MITVKMIADSIKDMLYQLYPSCTFYIQGIPEGFQRPSFHIYLDNDRSEDGNRLLTHEKTSLGIKYYPPVEGSIPPELEHIIVYSSIKDTFRKGFVDVGDRKLKVSLLRGGKQDDNCLFIVVKLEYSEERPMNEPAYDLMEEINIK